MKQKTNLKDALIAAVRVWVFTTIGLWLPGLLGWIHEVSKWAEQKGAPAFPDPSNLAYLFVAALTAAFPAAVAGLWRYVENIAGRSFLPRPAGPGTPSVPGERGAADTRTIAWIALVVAVIVLLALLL